MTALALPLLIAACVLALRHLAATIGPCGVLAVLEHPAVAEAEQIIRGAVR